MSGDETDIPVDYPRDKRGKKEVRGSVKGVNEDGERGDKVKENLGDEEGRGDPRDCSLV